MQYTINKLTSIPGKKIITWSTNGEIGGFHMEDDRVISTSWDNIRRLWNLKDKDSAVGISVRQLTNRFENTQNVRITILRSFIVTKSRLIQLTPAVVKNSHEYNPITGKYIGPEIGVEYA